MPLAERDVVGMNLAFRLESALLADHALLLRVSTFSQLTLAPRIIDRATFEIEQARGLLTGGMLAALAILFAVLMLAAWIATRDIRFLAFVLLYSPWQWRRTSILGRIAMAYLFATCASAVLLLVRTWFPTLSTLAVAHFWTLNLLFQTLMLVAVLAVSGRVLREVPEQARQLEQAQREHARFELLAREFRDLLQVISHEIRNPASSLRLIAHNVRHGVVSPAEAAIDLQHIASHLSDIVTALHAQRPAFGASDPADFRYDLRARVEQALSVLGERLDRRRLDLTVVEAPDVRRHLLDAPRLALILTNLLDNTCKGNAESCRECFP